MNVSLGKFARSGVEARLGSNIRIAVLAALRHYVRRLKSGRRPVPPPPPRLCWAWRVEPDTTFELQVSPETRATLEHQAEKHHVPLNNVLVHAVFVYLSDLESSADIVGWADGPLH